MNFAAKDTCLTKVQTTGRWLTTADDRKKTGKSIQRTRARIEKKITIEIRSHVQTQNKENKHSFTGQHRKALRAAITC